MQDAINRPAIYQIHVINQIGINMRPQKLKPPMLIRHWCIYIHARFIDIASNMVVSFGIRTLWIIKTL